MKIIIIIIQCFICNCSIIVFNSQNYRSGHFAFNSEGDMIIEYSANKNRLFYGLKSNGKYYFKDSSQNRVPTKEMTFEYEDNDVKRYEAKNIFVTINNKEYLFSIATSTSVAELIDLNEENNISYEITSVSNFLGNTIYSYVFSLLKMDSNKCLISYISDKKYILQTFQFSQFSLSSSDYTLTTSPDPYGINFDNRIVNCFIMDSKIVVFLVGYDEAKYYLFIYDFNLNVQNIGNLPEIGSISNFNRGLGIFSKAFHLENRDAIFIYFGSPSSSSLKLKTGTISEDNKSFNVKINKNINEYGFNYNVLLNDFVKINSKRFIYIGLPSDNSKAIYIILFDLYNDYNSMNMRFYQENFDNFLYDNKYK